MPRAIASAGRAQHAPRRLAALGENGCRSSVAVAHCVLENQTSGVSQASSGSWPRACAACARTCSRPSRCCCVWKRPDPACRTVGRRPPESGPLDPRQSPEGEQQAGSPPPKCSTHRAHARPRTRAARGRAASTGSSSRSPLRCDERHPAVAAAAPSHSAIRPRSRTRSGPPASHPSRGPRPGRPAIAAHACDEAVPASRTVWMNRGAARSSPARSQLGDRDPEDLRPPRLPARPRRATPSSPARRDAPPGSSTA
jgi:hypothetical protein